MTKYQSQDGKNRPNELGKYIQNVFPNVKAVRKWCSESKRKAVFYEGLTEKNYPESPAVTELQTIMQWVPHPFYVTKSDEHVQMVMLGEEINGNKLVKTVTFQTNGTWELNVGETNIKLEEYCIGNTFELTRASVHNVCSIVYKIRPCMGILEPEKHVIKDKSLVIEYVGERKEKRYKVLSCQRVLTFLQKTQSSCGNCRNYVRFGKENVAPHGDVVSMSNECEPEKPSDDNSVVLTNENHEDMRAILESLLPGASGNMLNLLLNQKQNLTRDPKGRRWDKNTLSLCLSLWCRSPRNYDQLRESKVLILPTGRTLSLYKHAVEQKAGFINDVFQWMKIEAEKSSCSDQKIGGICIDEMSIQEDLCMVKREGEVQLIGFVDMGKEAEHLQVLCTGKRERPLATHVLQFLYLGLNGFRFPFACFPVTQTKAANLHFLFWQAVKYLCMYGFKVAFVSMDGAQANRDFMKMFFPESSPILNQFSTPNIWSRSDPQIIFIMDYSHVIKRIRNNILKSGHSTTHNKTLYYNTTICWEHWINAFRWDCDTNAFPIHRKLTNDHLFLTQESKMRNKLAEDALSCEMLFLMESFQKSLGEAGNLLDDTIDLLKATSTVVSVFRDRRPICDVEDQRLHNLNESLRWFNDWENHIMNRSDLAATEKGKMLMSQQTREDLNSCIVGFTKLCKDTMKSDKHSIVPARINSDVIENVFCQQRGIINGANTNPTFYQYSKNVNSIILGQNTISKNANAAQKACEPFCFNVDRPIKPRKTSVGRKPLTTLNVAN